MENENEKRSNPVKKILVSVFCGLLFGGFAAVSFFAVMEVGHSLGILDKEIVQKTSEVDKKKDLELKDLIPQAEEETESEVAEEIDSVVENKNDIILTQHEVTPVVTDVTHVVENVMPSIVSIQNNFSYNYYYFKEDATAKGSGIIVGSNDNEILIATNFHVIENNNSLSVTFCDETEAPAAVKGTDQSMDLAVIAVKFDDIDMATQNTIKVATMGDSDMLKVGEPAIAIGNALGYGQSVTTGVISAVNREMDMNSNGLTAKFIQTDAAINEGNSGGALLNLAGELIGINSNKIGGSLVEGMGYAIPISSAKPIIEELMLKETRVPIDEDEQACLGISGATISSQEASIYGYPAGVLVASVYDGSPADEAGIEKGDLIFSFDGEKITSMEQLQRLLKYYQKGETVEVGLYKDGSSGYEESYVSVTLASRADVY